MKSESTSDSSRHLQDRRHTLTERHDIRLVADWQQLPIAPHVPRSATEVVGDYSVLYGSQVIPGEQDFAALRANAKYRVSTEFGAAASALQIA